MELIILLLPLGLLLGGVALCACIYSIQSGQFDDLDTPPVRALLDDCEADKPDS
jgi:cbb3-type cytochrome oxidase maturation protein